MADDAVAEQRLVLGGHIELVGGGQRPVLRGAERPETRDTGVPPRDVREHGIRNLTDDHVGDDFAVTAGLDACVAATVLHA